MKRVVLFECIGMKGELHEVTSDRFEGRRSSAALLFCEKVLNVSVPPAAVFPASYVEPGSLMLKTFPVVCPVARRRGGEMGTPDFPACCCRGFVW